mgnify:CR=1 FL=1
MSETRPVYIPCASGNQAQTELLVRQAGSLVEILGHPLMHLTPADARAMIAAVKEVLAEIEGPQE